MSYSRAGIDAIIATVLWTIACVVSVYIPYGIGGLIPLLGVLATIRDMDNTKSGPAIFAAFVSMLFAFALGDGLEASLYVIAVILGVVKIIRL